MSNPHTYTTDAMKTTSVCDPNIANENLEYLKYEVDNSGGGVVDFNNLGTVTTDITLAENVITTAYFSGTNTITLPTVTDTTKQVVCVLDFTTASTGQPTITNTNLKWSDLNQGKAPSSYSIITGVHNILTFKSVWEGSTLYWEAEYTTFGGVEINWTQPILTSDGTLGGTSFAVYNSNPYAGNQTTYGGYNAFDGGATSSALFSEPSNYIYYFPQALKMATMSWVLYDNTFGAFSWVLYGSNNNIDYTTLHSGSFASGGATRTLEIPISNRQFYNYYKMTCVLTSGSYSGSATTTIVGTYIST